MKYPLPSAAFKEMRRIKVAWGYVETLQSETLRTQREPEPAPERNEILGRNIPYEEITTRTGQVVRPPKKKNLGVMSAEI